MFPLKDLARKEISGEINGGVKPLSAVLWNQHQIYKTHLFAKKSRC